MVTPYIYPTQPYSPFSRPQAKPLSAGVKEAPLWEISNNNDPLTRFTLSNRLFNYVSPMQALALFAAGMGSSFPLKWFANGLKMKPLNVKLINRFDNFSDPVAALAKKADGVEEQTAVYITQGPGAALIFALKNPGPVQDRLKAYFGASVAGYLLGTLADGLQEVWVRKEETQIRADLLNRLSVNFRNSIREKNNFDNELRETARQKITTMLKQCNIPQPEALLMPLPDVSGSKQCNYPYEPAHFSAPTIPPVVYRRFGESGEEKTHAPSSLQLKLVKGGIYGFGLITGLLGQYVFDLMQKGTQFTKGIKQVSSQAVNKLYLCFNITELEALFLTGNLRILLSVLGITALAKLGKMLVQGYRSIEVTRQNAKTELTYQSYNWMALDPTYHRIAEEEALTESLKKLYEAIPYEWNNRQLLGQRIQTILTNVGRNSAPKYFQMTPPVNLVDARS